MQHEAAGHVPPQSVEALRVALGPQRHGGKGLGLSPLEEGRAVRARYDAGLDMKRPNVGQTAAIEPKAFLPEAPEAVFDKLFWCVGRAKRGCGS